MSQNVPITVAYGDGIGPEIMAATLDIIKAAGARIDIEPIEVGEQVYLRGISAGIEPSAWESLRRTHVFLKAPITTPQGGGYKSSECHRPHGFRTLRQCSPLRRLFSFCGYKASYNGCRHCS